MVWPFGNPIKRHVSTGAQRPKTRFSASLLFLRFSALLCFFCLKRTALQIRFSAGQFFELEPHKLDLIYSKTRFLPQTGSP
ncbi:MAG: hypothetical protein IKC51_09105, partial [Myxococcaceae bacterium]|nr:hypothetical protein [Myxococcaceae bacterium]